MNHARRERPAAVIVLAGGLIRALNNTLPDSCKCGRISGKEESFAASPGGSGGPFISV
jgi:hypothetical protein